MAPPAIITSKDKAKDRLLDGSGVALEATTLVLITRTGMDKEIAHNPPDHIFLSEMITPWIHLLLSAKPQTTKNARSTARQANASNVGSKATLSAVAPIKRHVLKQLTLF